MRSGRTVVALGSFLGMIFSENRCTLSGTCRSSGARQKRGSLLDKRRHALLDLFAVHAVLMPSVRGRGIERTPGDFVDGALHAAHCDRRIAGEQGCEPIDLGVEPLGCNERGEIADPQHFACVDFFRG
jgi:hypothetical protein